MSVTAIIGGGASGIVSALAAAKNPCDSVTIYESGARIGRKILATGNGRCNLTNVNACEGSYHGKSTDFVRGAENTFWVDETLDFFKRLGVITKTEDRGKVYPYCDRASAVLDALRAGLDRVGVNVRTGFDVKTVTKKSGGFLITSYKGESAYADKVIVATGGKAAPDLGSNGSGYAILSAFGHHIAPTRPSLVQIKTDTETVKKLKGIKLNAAVTLGEKREDGEVLFTDYGLSGPPIFYLSSTLENQKYISLDIMPEYAFGDLLELILSRREMLYDTRLESFFVGMIDKRVGQAIMKDAGIAPLSRTADELTDNDVKRLARLIKDWRFEVRGTMSWNNAQVTKGGALTDEFDPYTMQSRLVDGLYAVGEVLDIDGDCGGYNLQWAWSSGYLAGTACAQD